jgi:hypothetical protein
MEGDEFITERIETLSPSPIDSQIQQLTTEGGEREREKEFCIPGMFEG